MVNTKCSLEVSINGGPKNLYVQDQEYTMNIMKMPCNFSNKF